MAECFAEFPPRTALPDLTLHESTIREDINATEVAKSWLSSLLQSIQVKDATAFSSLFFQDAWWRDLVALSWAITSKNGPAEISNYVLGSTAPLKNADVIETPPLFSQIVDMGPMTFIQFGFTFSTKYGSGRGIVRLGNDGPGSWKAWTASTQLEQLPQTGSKPSDTQNHAATNGMNGANGEVGEAEELQVLVVGAGQAGAMLAAWLQQLGVKYLVVDKAARPGDAWRARYDSVKSHTASYGDHFPFLKYPSNWPNFLDRDPIAKWIEHYCGIMDLNILQNAAVTTIDRDDETGKYSVNVAVQGSQRIFKANHVVLATGITSNTPNLPDIKQQDTFKGLVYHTSKHKSASKIPDLGNKRVVVIGAASSGHDVAQDFVNHGAKSVSMIQRSRLAVTSTDSIEKFQAKPWGIPGVGTDDADLLTASMSGAIALTLGVGMAQMMSHNDKELLDGLEKAGMALVRGEDGVGILDFQLLKFGHFYIDQGASPMIVDGRIKVFRCTEGVKEFYDGGIILANDTRVEADVVVFATGFKGIDVTLEPLLGKEIATAALSWTKTNKETELNGAGRPTGVPGLWYVTGGFLLSRLFSKLVALQISAIERGMNDSHWKNM